MRIKEQETRLIVHEHDEDDEDDYYYLDIQGTDALQACYLEIFGVVDVRKECGFN